MKKLTRRNLEKFLEKYKTDKKVLDIGSGGSTYNRFFPNRLTVDIDSKRKPEVIADAHHLPFENNSFEIILCTEVLEHVKNPQEVINEFYRVLMPGGRVILTTRFVYPIHDAPNDFWRFTKYGLMELFKNWEIIELEAENLTFSTVAVLLQRISFQTKLKVNKFSKGILYIFIKLFDNLNFFVREEFGDIQRSIKEENILSSGYYIVAKKKI